MRHEAVANMNQKILLNFGFRGFFHTIGFAFLIVANLLEQWALR